MMTIGKTATEIKVLYLCNGKKKCMGHAFCALGTSKNGCRHTSDAAFALNGSCEHPDQCPERFKLKGHDIHKIPIYEEALPDVHYHER